MGIYEDKVRAAIKSRYGSVPKMSTVTGIPATTIYHALERGMENTTTKTRYMIIDALNIDDSDVLSPQSSKPTLTNDETELLDIWRNITPIGQQQLLVFARGCLATHSKNNQLRANQTTA